MNLTDNERATLDELLLHPVFLKAAKVIQDRFIPLGRVDDDIKEMEGVSGSEKVTFQHFRSTGIFLAFAGLLMLTKQSNTAPSTIHNDPRSHGGWAPEDVLSPKDLAEAKAVKDRIAQREAEDRQAKQEASQKKE